MIKESLSNSATISEAQCNYLCKNSSQFKSDFIPSSLYKDKQYNKKINNPIYEILYHSIPSIIFTLTSDNIIYSINNFGADRLGYCSTDLIGQSIRILGTDSVTDDRKMEDVYQKCLDHPKKIHRWETTLCCKNGSYIFVWETAQMVKDALGNLFISISCQEITEMQTVIDEKMSALTHDKLTGLVNRQAFEQQINSLIKTNQREYCEHALCHIDLDQFKVINDTCGHIAGDKLLFQIAKVLRNCVREYDTVARLGGDEFAILIINCALDEAKRISKKILLTISTHNFIWDEQCLRLGASIGLVQIYTQSKSATQILSAAESACNIAKEQGRDRIHIFRENDPELAKRYQEMQWVAHINQALDENRFRLFYQVIAPIKAKNKGSYFELLLRMVDNNGSIVSPSSFMPAAERYGLTTKIDRWVIRHAIEWLSSDPQRVEHLHRASINLSGCSIEDSDFIEFLIQEIYDSAIPASKICLEITETVAISNVSNAAKSIQRLKNLGCIIAIDDFGTGFSSFAYLKYLPIDVLKIDGMFIKDILENPTNLALVKSINEISHVIGKQTVAEFVETPEILEKLKQIGVDYAQGYAIGLPTPIQNAPLQI